MLNLKTSITKAIEAVQNTCSLHNMDEFDEIERTTLSSRCREILHQGFRYGFEVSMACVCNSVHICNDRNCNRSDRNTFMIKMQFCAHQKLTETSNPDRSEFVIDSEVILTFVYALFLTLFVAVF